MLRSCFCDAAFDKTVCSFHNVHLKYLTRASWNDETVLFQRLHHILFFPGLDGNAENVPLQTFQMVYLSQYSAGCSHHSAHICVHTGARMCPGARFVRVRLVVKMSVFMIATNSCKV